MSVTDYPQAETFEELVERIETIAERVGGVIMAERRHSQQLVRRMGRAVRRLQEVHGHAQGAAA